ncbi:MobA/MobL family protein [Variovorax paradoxus]|uniref:MobA/MobL family protein n=1 Tax=Variovorax paradoxus TaxID=34073 RepID=UPI003ECF0328
MASFYWNIKSGKKGSGRKHSNYITRTGYHADREDLIAQGHGNLPHWANGASAVFWGMGDKYERSNGAVYREVVVALPNELSTEQYVELARSYAREIAGSKPHEFAVHRPIAAIGGCPQPHAHIMISDRLPDGVERSAEQYFRRYNSVHPELGGCKKDSGGKTRSELAAEVSAKRIAWAETQNAFLERHGHVARVDPRSRAVRGLPPATERHLGPARTRALDAKGKAALTAGRAASD